MPTAILDTGNRKKTRRLVHRILVNFLVFIASLFTGILLYDLTCIAFLPSPKIKLDLKIPHDYSISTDGKTIELEMSCLTPYSYIPSRTVVSDVLLDGSFVRFLWWPARDIYSGESGENLRENCIVGEKSLASLPLVSLTEGSHIIHIKSVQYKGKYIIKKKSNVYNNYFRIRMQNGVLVQEF